MPIQAPVWAWAAACQVSSSDTEVTFVFGYIRGDDYWHYRRHFEESIVSLVRQFNEQATIRFSYPFEWSTKREILQSFIDYPEVFGSISWGGDTATAKAKAKDREDLTATFQLLQDAASHGEQKVVSRKKPTTQPTT